MGKEQGPISSLEEQKRKTFKRMVRCGALAVICTAALCADSCFAVPAIVFYGGLVWCLTKYENLEKQTSSSEK